LILSFFLVNSTKNYRLTHHKKARLQLRSFKVSKRQSIVNETINILNELNAAVIYNRTADIL